VTAGKKPMQAESQPEHGRAQRIRRLRKVLPRTEGGFAMPGFVGNAGAECTGQRAGRKTMPRGAGRLVEPTVADLPKTPSRLLSAPPRQAERSTGNARRIQLRTFACNLLVEGGLHRNDPRLQDPWSATEARPASARGPKPRNPNLRNQTVHSCNRHLPCRPLT